MSTQEETEKMSGHSEDADGIEEYDNDLPRWWVGLFIVTVIWGVWVMLDWHVFNSKSLAGQFTARMEELGLDEAPDLSGIVVEINEANIAAGHEVFLQTCGVCHEADGSGNIGPSLIDTEWLYDHHVEGILESVALGRPNGMPGWLAPLGEEKVALVTAYVASLTDAPSRAEADQDVAIEDTGGTAPSAFPGETEGQQDSAGTDASESPQGVTNDHAADSAPGVDAAEVDAQDSEPDTSN